jgi:hypothetical protein
VSQLRPQPCGFSRDVCHTRSLKRATPQSLLETSGGKLKLMMARIPQGRRKSCVVKDRGHTSWVKDGSSARAKYRNATNGRASAPPFLVGTRFCKEFPGHGTFHGTIMSFDGVHYKVYYPSDDDSEELSDCELVEVDIIEMPTSRARASTKKVDP